MQRYGVDKQGVYVYTVYDNTAASEAGLVVGDLILKFDGTDIKTSADLSTALLKKKSGDKVDIVIYRNGEEKTLNVTLGEEEKTDNNGKNSNNFNPGGNGGNNNNGGFGNGGYDDIYDYFFNW